MSLFDVPRALAHFNFCCLVHLWGSAMGVGLAVCLVHCICCCLVCRCHGGFSTVFIYDATLSLSDENWAYWAAYHLLHQPTCNPSNIVATSLSRDLHLITLVICVALCEGSKLGMESTITWSGLELAVHGDRPTKSNFLYYLGISVPSIGMS